MESNGKSNVSPAIMANQKKLGSRLFTNPEDQEKLEYVPVADANLLKDLMQTPDAPTVSKMDYIDGGNKPMLFLKWLVRQVYSYALLAFGAFVLTLVLIVAFAGVAFGWQAGSILATLVFGG